MCVDRYRDTTRHSRHNTSLTSRAGLDRPLAAASSFRAAASSSAAADDDEGLDVDEPDTDAKPEAALSGWGEAGA